MVFCATEKERRPRRRKKKREGKFVSDFFFSFFSSLVKCLINNYQRRKKKANEEISSHVVFSLWAIPCESNMMFQSSASLTFFLWLSPMSNNWNCYQIDRRDAGGGGNWQRRRERERWRGKYSPNHSGRLKNVSNLFSLCLCGQRVIFLL